MNHYAWKEVVVVAVAEEAEEERKEKIASELD